MMVVTGVPLTKSLLLTPLVVLYLFLFALGMAMILATMNVFFRDTRFLWGVVVLMWTYLTPIFYPETIIPAQLITLYHMNPMYQFIYFMRCITLGGVSPTPVTYLVLHPVQCGAAAGGPVGFQKEPGPVCVLSVKGGGVQWRIL